jgi:hypothetical protein
MRQHCSKFRHFPQVNAPTLLQIPTFSASKCANLAPNSDISASNYAKLAPILLQIPTFSASKCANLAPNSDIFRK